MKVKELIKQLKKYPEDTEVLIQQGEDFDYAIVNSIKLESVVSYDTDEDIEIEAVLIKY